MADSNLFALLSTHNIVNPYIKFRITIPYVDTLARVIYIDNNRIVDST